MVSDFLKIIITRLRAAVANRPRRVGASLARYVVLGLAALSILPASTAHASPTVQDKSSPSGRAEPTPLEHPRQQSGPADVAAEADVKRLLATIDPAPLADFLKKAAASYRLIEPSDTVEVSIEAERGEDGSFSIGQVFAAGDPRLVELALSFVRAVGESRALAFLEGASHLNTKFMVGQSNIRVEAEAEFDSDIRAAEMAAATEAFIAYRLFKVGGNRSTEGRVWNNMTVSPSGKHLAMKLEMSREEAGYLLHSKITPD